MRDERRSTKTTSFNSHSQNSVAEAPCNILRYDDTHLEQSFQAGAEPSRTGVRSVLLIAAGQAQIAVLIDLHIRRSRGSRHCGWLLFLLLLFRGGGDVFGLDCSRSRFDWRR